MTIPHEEAEKAIPEKPKNQGAQPKQKSRLARLSLAALGLFAACLLYGDGMITPAISVLSAVEGLAVITLLNPLISSTIKGHERFYLDARK